MKPKKSSHKSRATDNRQSRASLVGSLRPGDLPPASPPGLTVKAVNLLGMLSTFAAIGLMTAMAIRPINSPDIGYHLAYGEHYLDTGKIVQTNLWVYPPIDPAAMRDPDETGPGCRFDPATGVYHFINANWLSQAILAAINRKAGMNGLVVLQAALVGIIAVLLVVPMRRNGAPWHWIGPAILVVALAGDLHLSLRPEVFGFLILVGQWAILAGPGFGWKRAAGVIVLQILAANVHSYFPLGVALVGAMFIQGALEWRGARGKPPADAAAAKANFQWKSAALAGMVLACFANPWFARGAAMPVQTILYMQENHIPGKLSPDSEIHPWATISELRPPLENFSSLEFKDWALPMTVLCLAGAGALCAALRRRCGWAMVLVGMGLVAWGVTRNVGPASMIVLPTATAVLWREWALLRARRLKIGPRATCLAGGLVAVLGLALAGHTILGVMTNRFYLETNRSTRFGLGCSRFMLPLDAADWIDKHKPAGHIYAPFDSSSNLMCFTHPHQDMPRLSNTWACPPYLLTQCLLWEADPDMTREFPFRFREFAVPFDEGVRKYDIRTVVLHYPFGVGQHTPLLNKLATGADWVLVDMGPNHFIFVHRNDRNLPPSLQDGITHSNFNVDDFAARCAAADPVPWYALNQGGEILMKWADALQDPRKGGQETSQSRLAWLDHAAAVFRRALDGNPNYPEAMTGLAESYFRKGVILANLVQKDLGEGQSSKAEQARKEAGVQWDRAHPLLMQALRLKPGYPRAMYVLKEIDKISAALDRMTGHSTSPWP
jgi:hypothetical protein